MQRYLSAVAGLFATIIVVVPPTIAQQAFFKVVLENVSPAYDFQSSGTFDTPDGASSPAPIGPGDTYTIEFDAAPGASLSFVTMFVPSNDLFYAPGPDGIALWNPDGTQVGGDVTDQIMLWDAGTEENQEPGVGPDQVQRQSGPNTGAPDPIDMVRPVSDAFTYPATSDVVRVTLTPLTPTHFSATIENVSMVGTLMPSDASMQAVPLSPGLFVVHSAAAPIFSSGSPDTRDGLEAIAEDGNPASLGASIAARTGVNQIFSPGVWAVHSEANPLFTDGQPDNGKGLESIAEDGSPTDLSASLALEKVTTGGPFSVPRDAAGPAPIGTGGAYEFTIAATPGGRLSIASMLVQSNDLFVAPDGDGIALWDTGGQPVDGDFTDKLELWDAGTEVNEQPGFGLNQAPRQTGPDTGVDEDGLVRNVDDGFSYPPLADIVRLTITPLETTEFTVRIENVSTGTTLMPSDGTMQPVPLSPGVWVVHAGPAPLFSEGAVDRGDGLEHVAEDGDPGALSSALAAKVGFGSGAFATPDGGTGPGAIGPGQSYTFEIVAAPGSRLSAATMFVPSNDLFFAPSVSGIMLFNEEDVPVDGDLTSALSLWDAGTEVNQEPGAGPDQVQRQSGPDTGAADPDNTVRLVGDGFTYPSVEDVVRLTIVPTATARDDVNPQSFLLHQNYPNPFNPTTTITYTLASTTDVLLTVVDVLGRRVRTLAAGTQSAGEYRVTLDARDLSSGLYLYRLYAAGKVQSRSMVLLR